MAVMLPPQVAATTESEAECFVFRKLKDELPDSDWIVLHSLGITTHQRKPWAEIDFVAIGPPGIFCLEVKGGTIARRNRVWTTTTRAGNTKELKESPFSQVGSAAAALHQFLLGRAPAISKSVTGYGVLFPDVRLTVAGPDIARETVYDAEDAAHPITEYLDKLAKYWHARCARDWGRDVTSLSPAARRSIRDAIARDFDLCPSLRARVGDINDHLIRLTEEQCRVFSNLSDNSRVLVRGGAGTGKTVLGAAEARRLAREGRRTMFTCFNRRLAEHVRSALSDVPTVTVTHLHGFMSDVVKRADLQSRLPDAQPEDLFQVFYPELCLEALLDGRTDTFDALIVDEGQDLLLEPYLDVLDAAVSGGLSGGLWRLFLDPNQNIYDGTAACALDRIERASPTKFRLSVNCRNSAPIATTTALLSGIRSDAVLVADGPAVEQFWYRDRPEQRRLVAAQIRQLLHRGIRPQELVILSSRRLANSCLAGGIAGITAQLVDVADGAASSAHDIRFSTISSFKGLEADAVLLIDVDDLTEPQSLLSVYVGASRARALLCVFLDESQRSAYNDLAYRFGRSVSGD